VMPVYGVGVDIGEGVCVFVSVIVGIVV
jgi:hypothetical protein